MAAAAVPAHLCALGLSKRLVAGTRVSLHQAARLRPGQPFHARVAACSVFSGVSVISGVSVRCVWVCGGSRCAGYALRTEGGEGWQQGTQQMATP
jgi:carbonic anhydrase